MPNSDKFPYSFQYLKDNLDIKMLTEDLFESIFRSVFNASKEDRTQFIRFLNDELHYIMTTPPSLNIKTIIIDEDDGTKIPYEIAEDIVQIYEFYVLKNEL